MLGAGSTHQAAHDLHEARLIDLAVEEELRGQLVGVHDDELPGPLEALRFEAVPRQGMHDGNRTGPGGEQQDALAPGQALAGEFRHLRGEKRAIVVKLHVVALHPRLPPVNCATAARTRPDS
jgi:hypothetical protein